MKKKEKKEKGEKKGFFTRRKLIVLVLLLALAGGGAFGALTFLKKDGYPGTKMKQVSLSEELLKFTYNHLPETYNGLVAINSEIVLIEMEIQRIEQIEKEFPNQKKITDTERKRWLKTVGKLKTFLGKLEFKIEGLYVALQVNPVAGKEQIENRKEELSGSVTSVLEPTREQTLRLKPEKESKKGLMAKIKGLIGKK